VLICGETLRKIEDQRCCKGDIFSSSLIVSDYPTSEWFGETNFVDVMMLVIGHKREGKISFALENKAKIKKDPMLCYKYCEHQRIF